MTMRKRIRLEKLLLEEGLITQERLNAIHEAWKRSGLKLTGYLVRHHICREEDIVETICRKTGIKRYVPTNFPPNAIPRDRIPAEIARTAEAVPLGMRGTVLLVAMVDPQDIDALDSLEHAANCDIEAVICLSEELSQLFGAVYGLFGIGGAEQEQTTLPPVLGERSEFRKNGTPKLRNDDLSVEPLLLKINSDIDANTDDPETSTVVRLVNAILAQAVREGASDIHISPTRDSLLIRFRVDGKLHLTPSPPRHHALSIISRIKILGNMDISTTRIPQDGRFTMVLDDHEINVRVSCLPTIHGENVVMRLLDMNVIHEYTLDKLGMDARDADTIQSVIHRPYGMILSTGPTGSGKSTSLYAILQQLNKPDINIITLEDPVEYRVDGIRQVQLNERAGLTFASGLRSILRQDPDIIMVGEIRDPETARIAVQAAFTGHLVLATLHTNDAPAAITRLEELGIEPFLIAPVLLCTFAQRLVRTVCPHCAESYTPATALLLSLGITENADFRRGAGCYYCRNTGYLGRTGLFEVLPATTKIQQLILDRAHSQRIGEEALQLGIMRTLAQDAARKVCAGITTVEEAVRVVRT